MLAKKPLDNGFSADAFNIEQVARFCTTRLREATDDLVPAYLTIGGRLADLHAKLKKTTPRGDNERIGWQQAFQQKHANGQPKFPFGRKHAEKLIMLHTFFTGIAMPVKFHKQLPSALNAILAIASLKFTRQQIEKAIEEKIMTTFSDAGDVRNLAKNLGVIKKTERLKPSTVPKRERIAQAFEFLAKHQLTLDDLIEETGGGK